MSYRCASSNRGKHAASLRGCPPYGSPSSPIAFHLPAFHSDSNFATVSGLPSHQWLYEGKKRPGYCCTHFATTPSSPLITTFEMWFLSISATVLRSSASGSRSLVRYVFRNAPKLADSGGPAKSSG